MACLMSGDPQRSTALFPTNNAERQQQISCVCTLNRKDKTLSFPFPFCPFRPNLRQVCFPLHSYLCLISHTGFLNLFIYFFTFVKGKSDIWVELSEYSEADLNET